MTACNVVRIGLACDGGDFECGKGLERLPARHGEGPRFIGLGDAAGAFRDIAAAGLCGA
jgi:hypothetical protein